MTLIQYIFLYVLTVPVFFIIDMFWLGIVAKDFYQTKLGYLLGPVNWGAALAFYFIYIVGILIFSVVPALTTGASYTKALMMGALFGLFAYATYDLTNYATVKDWPPSIVIVDILWGIMLTGSVATLSFLLGKHFVL
jgi:uncharacterized membrane protein